MTLKDEVDTGKKGSNRTVTNRIVLIYLAVVINNIYKQNDTETVVIKEQTKSDTYKQNDMETVVIHKNKNKHSVSHHVPYGT